LLDRQSHFFRATNELSTKSKTHRNFVMSGEADYGFHRRPAPKKSQQEAGEFSSCTLTGFV